MFQVSITSTAQRVLRLGRATFTNRGLLNPK